MCEENQNVQRLGIEELDALLPLALRNLELYDEDLLNSRQWLIDNGYTQGRNKHNIAYKKLLPKTLPKEAFSWALGLALSDASLERTTPKEGPLTRLKIQQCKDNLQLLVATQRILKPWIMKIYPPKQEGNYEIASYKGEAFNAVADLLQDTNVPLVSGCVKKVIPPNIEEYLDPISVTAWYLGDGTRHGREAQFMTQGFSLRCHVRLAIALRKKFGLQVEVRVDYIKEVTNTKMYYLRVRTKSSDLFRQLITPYMLPKFSHKQIPPRIRKMRKDL